jgi:hypothetical protein
MNAGTRTQQANEGEGALERTTSCLDEWKDQKYESDRANHREREVEKVRVREEREGGREESKG